MVQGKREMDEELIRVGRWSVVLLDDIVDVLRYVSESIKMGEIEKEGRTVTAELTKRAKMKATIQHALRRVRGKTRSTYQGCNGY